jgi:hypothetical protein
MNIKKLAIENYKYFCSLEGSDYIASEFALEKLLKIISFFKIKNILEIGMGIGSVSDTILKFKHYNNLNILYDGTENNDFCLSVLPQNVAYFNEVQLYSNLEAITEKKYDLIIIDGSDDHLFALDKLCNKHAILFVEGGRYEQTLKILNMFSKHLYVNVISLNKNPVYAHEGRSIESYIGGGQLIFINPTFQMRLYWFKEKLATFLKRKIRIYRIGL